MKILSPFLLFAVLLSVACNENPEAVNMPPSQKKDSMDAVHEPIKKEYASVKFDNLKDPVCGMPIKAGISDTAHLKGKTLAFCATECKEEFLKDPAAYPLK